MSPREFTDAFKVTLRGLTSKELATVYALTRGFVTMIGDELLSRVADATPGVAEKPDDPIDLDTIF